MKKINFLIKLFADKRLDFIDESENLYLSYVNKSESNFESGRILLFAGKLEESVSLLYYSMYNLLLALLFRCGIKCENHAGSIILLKELFQQEKLAEIISCAKKERIDKQYYTDFSITKSECMDMMEKTENFIFELKAKIKSLSTEDIKSFRAVLINSLKK